MCRRRRKGGVGPRQGGVGSAGFEIRERDVDSAAEKMWRTTSLNYSSFDAFKWGEFWNDQPSGKRALLEAAEQDTRELEEVGVI